ncbi:MAG: hypothetical protein GXO34_03890 [Deltaproteobacteria bacterium]|nr:hypothetical protein [Deltaproteobacteria bacterium]
MTHLDTGKYPAKHTDRTIPEKLRERILEAAKNQEISCRTAHHIATETGTPPAEIGRVIDLLEIRIVGCQLGLFDKSRDRDPIAPVEPSAELRRALEEKLANGRLSCAAAWELATTFDLQKREVTAVCEYLKIKIKPCQLGAF